MYKRQKEDQIDFGLITSPFEEQEEQETFPVKEIEDCFVAGRKFIQYKNKMLDLQELEKLPLICLEKNTSTRACMDRFLYQNHVEMHPEFELATSDMIVQFAPVSYTHLDVYKRQHLQSVRSRGCSAVGK